MKHFESFLSAILEEYIAYRQTLGYSNKNLISRLFLFDQYAKKNKADWNSLLPSFFLGFRQCMKGEPHTRNNILTTVRGFCQFLVRLDRCKENPMQDIPPFAIKAYIPFVFSIEEVENLLRAIQNRLRKTEKFFLKDLSIYLSILLLARCGLRISEPLRILRTHYRGKEGTIYIEKSKFKKDRLIPIPESVITQIDNYLKARNSLLCNDKNPYLLAGQKQKGLSTNQVYKVFHQAVKDIGMNQPRRTVANTTFAAPTPHSLRHSFAINTLMCIKQNGKPPQDALPVLAAYMGHRKYRYTAVYLKVLNAALRHGLVDFAVSQQKEI